MPQVVRGESSLYYEEHGTGTPVILLHGVGGNHASWFYQVAAWSRDFHVITIDARGFGRSTDVEGLGSSAFTDDLAYLLDHLALPKVVLVAQSMGGGTAVDFAVQHPQRVHGVVVADSLVWLQPPAALQAQIADNTQKIANLSQAERVLGPSFRKRHPAMTELYLQIASFNRYALRTLPGKLRKHSPEALADGGFPILFVVGEEDVLFPVAIFEQVAALVPGAQLIRLRQAGHSAYYEQPDAFCEQVGAWIQALK